MIDQNYPQLAVARQCQLVSLSRSSPHYQPSSQTEENLMFMRLIDQQDTRTPFYGSRRVMHWLKAQGHPVNRKRVQRMMRIMGLEAILPQRRLSLEGQGYKVYPYLLRGLKIEKPNQVWSTHIT